MTKIVLSQPAAGFNLSAINANFQKIQDEFNNKVLYRQNPAGEANQMINNQDMNGNRILNLPVPSSSSEAARLQDVADAIAGAKTASLTSFNPYKTIASTNVQGAIQEMVDDLASSTGSQYIGYQAQSTGSVIRTLLDKLTDTLVTPKDFGGVGNGTADDTAALQAMLNSGSQYWYIPPGKWKFSTLTIPQVSNFVLFGVGPASQLIQTGAGIKFPKVTTASCFDSHSTIHDIYIDGTAGTGNCLDTSYCQTLDINNLYINNIPVGYTGLKLDGNPEMAVYAHDVRVKNIRIYSTTAGVAGITLGSNHSDSTIDGFIMNGFFVVSYCILALSGAQTTVVSNSHPYNAKNNVVMLQGNNNDFGWVGCTFDNALNDIFYQVGSVRGRFSNCFFEAVPPSYHGLVFDNSYNNTVVQSAYSIKSTVAAACVQEVNGASGNKIIGGNVDNVANWTNLFNLSGTGSFAKGFQDYAKYDTIYNLTGVAQSAQAQNTTVQYGANGVGNLGNTGWSVPLDGRILKAYVFTDTTPAVGQTFTFNLQVNGTTIATATISNGAYSATIIPSPAYSVTIGSQITIQSVFSATSGSASPRYSVTLNG